MDYPKVSIIILNWNGLEDTVECLESLKKVTYPNYKVVVVDNGSEGDDVRILREKFGDYIHIVQNDKNYGFAEGNNIGMRYALTNLHPDYMLLLNNDTVVAPDFLGELVRAGESTPEIAILGPKIYYYDFRGRNNVIWCAGGKIWWWHPWVYQVIGMNADDLPQYQTITNVDWIPGTAMMLKSYVIEELSFLNSQYFFGHEDVEYCIRARKHGFKTLYVPGARIWHKVGMSRKKYDPCFADISQYHQLIKENFSVLVYIYQFLLLPVLLFKWGISYLTKYRDRETLLTFLSNFKRFILRRH